MAGSPPGQSIRRALGRLTGPTSPTLRPAVVGGLAVGQLLLRTVADLLLRVLDHDFIPAIVSVVAGSVIELGVESGLVAVLLFWYLLWALVPYVFSSGVAHVAEDNGFRVLAAGSVVLIPFALFQWGASGHPVVVWLGRGLVACPLALPVYVVLSQGRAFLGRASYVIAFTNAFLPTAELRAEDGEGPAVERRTPRFWAVFGLMTLVAFGYAYFLFLLLGLLLVVLSLMFPIPELLLLGWAGYRVVARPPEGRPTGTTAPRFDLEQRIIPLTGTAAHGFKGAMCVLLAVMGFVFPVLFLNMAVQVALGVAGSAGVLVAELSGVPVGGLVRLVLVVTTVTVVGAYGVWYWLRMFSRVPPFYDAWLERLPVDLETPPEREYGPLLPRPPGYYLPPMALLVLLGLLNDAEWSATEAIAGLAWMGTVAILAWSAYRGVVGEPQGAETDGIALPTSFAVQMVGTWLWLDLTSGDVVRQVLLGRASIRQLAETTLGSPGGRIGVGFTAVVLYAFYLMDVVHWKGTDGWRGVVYVPYLLGGAALLTLAAVLAAGDWRVTLAIVAVVWMLATVGLSLTDSDQVVDPVPDE